MNRSRSQEEKLGKICSWLSAPDPSTNYYKAHKQRQVETGLWLLESAKFAEWKERAASRLWLYGIPGCGKTILSSTIIEHLLQHYHDDTSIVTAYFYFDFNDTQKQDPELMLRSLLCQFLQRLVVVPNGVYALFSSCENGKRQPSLHALLEVTREAAQEFAHVYVVLDALDECTQRSELMDMLNTVARWQLNKLHLLITSRKERDIETSLESYIREEDAVCLQRDVVDQDIQRYVQQRLRDKKSLAKWTKDAAISQEIEDALMRGARGMYVFNQFFTELKLTIVQVPMGCMPARHVSKVSQPSNAAQFARHFAANARPDIRPHPYRYKQRGLRVRDAHPTVANVLCPAALC
ncbi:AAA-16 domain containing protein [Pyrenophora tritici-repentis]|nr:AAA-16 domain containing protein [Pyrenophora tritici-repentis]